MFTQDNTEGFSSDDLKLMNEALETLMSEGVDEQNASAIICNNWIDGENTVGKLIKR